MWPNNHIFKILGMIKHSLLIGLSIYELNVNIILFQEEDDGIDAAVNAAVDVAVESALDAAVGDDDRQRNEARRLIFLD